MEPTGMRADATARPAVRTSTAIAVLLVALAGYNVARSTIVPGAVDVGTNVAMAVAGLAVAWSAGMSRAELGLTREHLGRGLRVGAVVGGVIALLVVVAGVVASAGTVVTDVVDDEVDVSAPAMLLRVLVVIPIGTVLVEELLFRGVLYGLLRRTTTPLRAATWGALVFGAWHVVPAWRDADGDAGLAPWLVALLTFGATFVAGLGFEWLRHRGRHLAAPILVHIATNSTPFAVAWALT